MSRRTARMGEPLAVDRRSVLGTVAALVFVAAALRFWRLGEMPLFPDEAYYLLWSDRPALAYADHPAGIALLLRLSTALGGRDELGVRWLNALLSIVCVPLAYAVGRRYVNAVGGLVAAAAAALAPVFVVTGRVAYPDTLLAVLALVNLLLLATLLEGQRRTWQWLLFGVSLGLMANVKLTTGFYVTALAAYLLGWRRDLLRERGFWLAAAIALLGALPVVTWNASHSWVGIRQAIAQGSGYGLEVLSPARRLYHAWRYHTPPVAILGALAALCGLLALPRILGLRPAWVEAPPPSSPDQRALASRSMVLVLVAAAYLLPILLSRANNPRNLQLGLLVLFPLLGFAVSPAPAVTNSRGSSGSGPALGRTALVVMGLLLLGTAVYAAGTVIEILDFRGHLPHSVAAESISRDTVGRPGFALDLQPPPDSLAFAIDYSMAPQIAHYGGYPVYTAHTQYRLWGIPAFDNLTVLSQDYLPEAEIEARLREDFGQVAGPEQYDLPRQVIRVWQARGRRVPVDEVVEDLDYLDILHGAAMGLQ